MPFNNEKADEVLVKIFALLIGFYFVVLYTIVFLFPALRPSSFSQDYGFGDMLVAALILAIITTAVLYMIGWRKLANSLYVRFSFKIFSIRVIRIVIHAAIAFCYYLIALGFLLLFFPSFMSSIFDLMANSLGMRSNFVEFFLQAIIFLAIITGAFMEYIDMRKGLDRNPEYVNSSVSVDGEHDTQMPEETGPATSQLQTVVTQDPKEIVTCEYCGTKYSGDYSECPSCGTPLTR